MTLLPPSVYIQQQKSRIVNDVFDVSVFFWCLPVINYLFTYCTVVPCSNLFSFASYVGADNFFISSEANECDVVMCCLLLYFTKLKPTSTKTLIDADRELNRMNSCVCHSRRLHVVHCRFQNCSLKRREMKTTDTDYRPIILRWIFLYMAFRIDYMSLFYLVDIAMFCVLVWCILVDSS